MSASHHDPKPTLDPAWRDRNVIVAVSGGIAAYKTCQLVSWIAQSGAHTRVVMTGAATRFVGPLTFQSLSGNPVLTSIWQADDRPDSQHIGLARWADIVIIAPTTANLLAKIAGGICDDMVSLLVAALPREPKQTPVLLAPAMNADMWTNPITQRNLATVRETLGYETVGPDEGWQACRTQGAGRMSEPGVIYEAATQLLKVN